MSNKVRDIDIKNCTYYFFDNIINVIEIILKSTKIHTKIFLFTAVDIG